MNRPIVMAQLGGATAAQSVRVIKLAKPGDSQAQTVYLGYEQKFKIDLSAIANEKLTFVHIGEKLIILFDNQSTLTIDPFFDAAGVPRNNIAFDVNGREIDGSQFASTFPITTDQSVLPAAGDGAGGAPASGGNFRDAGVDPFASPAPLDLLGQEELGNLEFTEIDGPPPETRLPTIAGADRALQVDDQNLANGSTPGGPDSDSVVLTFTAGTDALTSFSIRGVSGLSPSLSWAVSGDGQQLIGSDERGAVVRITLLAPGVINPGQDGAVTVTVELLRNFDTHPDLNVDDLFQLGSIIVVGSGANGAVEVSATVSLAVSDDVPTPAGGEAAVSATVEEDGMSSIGLNPDQSDGNKDFTDDDTQDEASGAAGSLGALFKSGADSPLTFGLLADVDGLPTLFSKGEQVTYEVVGNTLTASAGGREVFTLTVNADGSWAFDLKDQLDHVDNGLNDENLQLRISANDSTGVGAIDFSSIIVATDSDGDSVSGLAAGSFTIAVEDDIPEQVPPYREGEGQYYQSIVGFVEEDGMSRTATAPFPADLSEGNKGLFDTNADDETGMGQPSLQTLFSAGADEPLTFSLVEDPSELLPTLFSKGVQLEYTTENGVLTATAGGRTVFVLTVQPDGTWTFDLQDQLDHVDNGFNDENTQLRTSADGTTSVGSIDFSRIIVATDFDGDSVEGLTPGSFAIIVEDDVPVIPVEGSQPVSIDEDDLNGPLSVGNNDQASGDDGLPNQSEPGEPTTVGGILPFSIGSDEPADVTFVEMHGDQVSGTFSNGSVTQVESKDRPLYYFWDQSSHTLYATWIIPANFGTGDPAANAAFKIKITDTDTGEYTFTLLDQLDHLPTFAGEQGPSSFVSLQHGEQPSAQPVVAFEDNIRLDLTYTVTDSDGDEATGTVSFDVDDDIPVLADVAPAVRYVDEDDIATWNPNSSNNKGSKGNDPNDGPGDGVNDGSETGNPPSNTTGPAFIQGTIANQVSVGADEPPKFTFLDLAGVRQKLEALGLQSQGVELDYDVITGANSNVVVGYDDDTGNSRYQSGDRLVFKLTLNTDGTYTFELFDQLDHDAPFDDASDVAGPGDTDPTSDQNTDLEDDNPYADVNSIDFGQVIKATDFDGDSIALDGRLTITIRDDIPEAKEGEIVRGVVEEEHLSQGNEDFGANPDLDQDHNQSGPDFNDTTTVVSGSGGDSLASLISVGADEPGKFTFKFGLTNTNIKDLDGNNVTSNGVQVKIASIVSGDDGGGDYQLLTAKAGGTTIFTLKIYEDGDWRFELKDQIDHHPINSADDIEDYLALNFSELIRFSDFDGDTIGLDAGSFYVKVIDDIPEAGIELTDKSVIHDESAGHDDSNDNDTNSNAVKAIFNNVPNPRGDDPDVASNPIGYAQNSQAIVASTSSVGADQPGSQVFSLSVVQGVDSGLRTTEGAVIRLYAENNGGVDYIVGRVGGETGLAAFAIHINSSNGVVSVVQYLSLKHDDINDHEESDDNGENSGDNQDLNQFPNPDQQDLDGKIRAVITVTDQDGDQDTASVDIGENIKFQDDGPKVKVEANDHKDADDIKVTLDETNPGGTPDDNSGFTDQVIPTTNPTNLKPIGQVSTPSNATSSVAVSDLFEVSVTEGADGVAPADIVTTYSLKLTDKNGSSDIGKYVETTLRVTSLDGTLYEGASADARTIWLVRQADGTILGVIGRNSSGGNSGPDGSVGDYIALKIELSGSATDPQFKVTQYLPIEHPTSGSSHDEGVSLNLVGSISSLQIVLNVKATDGDGDYDDDTHAIEVIDHDDSIIKIEDDGPTIVAGQTVTTAVYEDGLGTGNTDATRPGEVAPSGPASVTTAAGTLNALVDFGTDGPHPTQAFSLKVVGWPVDSNLNSRGDDVLIVSDGSILRGYVNSGGGSGFGAGDRLVFTLTVNGDGSYTFTLLDQIDHPDTIGGDNSENSLTAPLDLSSYIIAKDGDGDTVPLGTGAFVVTIQDDVPIQLAGNTATGTVEEEHGLPGANEDVDDAGNLDNDLGNNPNVVTNESTGTLDALVKIGADENGTFGIAPNPTGLPQLTSLDQPIVYHVSGNKLTAYVDSNPGGGLNAGDRQIFTLEITNTSTGAYKFKLLDNIDHHPDELADNVEGILALNLSSAITFTDRDGDTIVLSGGQNGNQGLIVTVIDDVPVLDGKICLTSGAGVAQYGANPADMLYAIPAGTGLTIDVTNLEEDAGHNNSLGYVFLNAAGQPISGVIIEDSVDDGDADRTITIPAGSVPAGAVMLGFFILPDGNDLNNIADGDAVTFQNIVGNWVAFHNGNPLSTADGHVLFSDRRLNPDISPDGNLTPGDDFDQNTSSGTTSNAHWEDTVGGIIFNGSDKDFNDLEFTVTVCATAPNIVVLVDEDGLSVHGIDNNRPGEEPGNGLATVTSAAAALAALVDFGADGPHATNPFSLAPTLSPQPIPYASKGGPILVLVNGNTLTGYVEEGAVDREVFTLTIQPNGTYTFTLKDQIDHPTLDGQNSGDNSENLLANAIDLSAFIVAMDGDGDKLTLPAGTFTVQVLDDIPVANAAAYVTGDVDEDDLKQATPEFDNSTGIPAEGSGDPDAPTDKFTFTAASLSSLIATVGADEPGSLIFNGNVSGAVQKVGGGAVKSKGDPVLFDTNGGNVVGFVDGNNNGQYEVGERLVFTMTSQPNGDIVFDLKDQIDHQFALGENAKVEINLSPALLITDYDGDTVPVAIDKFTIKIENDIPGNTAEKIQFSVGEDEMSEALNALPTPDLSTGIGSSAAGSDETIITNAKLKTLVVAGADEEVQFQLNADIGGKVFTLNGENVESLGEDVRFDFDVATQTLVGFVDNNSNGAYEANNDRAVFRMTALPGGDFRFDLLDQLDHDILGTSGSGDGKTLTIDLSKTIVARDYDGDIVNLGVESISVVVENDIPAFEVKANPDKIIVDETTLGVSASALFSNFFTVLPGADEPATVSNYALAVSSQGVLTNLVATVSNEQVKLVLNGSGVVEGRTVTSDQLVFTVSVNGSGTVTLTQLLAVAHAVDGPEGPAHNDPASLNVASLITLSATVTDSDGESVPGTANIATALQFNDDGPSISLTNVQPIALVTDDTNITTAASASFDGLFAASFGADSFKDADNNNVEDNDAVRYALSLNGGLGPVASGVFDTLSGEQVVLNVVGGEIRGTISGNVLVFKISVDANTGAVTLTQERAVVHDDPLDHDEGDANEPAVLTLPPGSQITLTATIEDGDGDTDSVSANITGSFAFKDDGPTIIGVVPATVTLGSTNLIVNGGFEDTVTNLPASQWGLYTTIPGWTAGSNNVPFELQRNSVTPFGAHGGSVKVELDGDFQGNLPSGGVVNGNGTATHATIQQSVTTVPGHTYQLDFYYSPRPDDGDGNNSGMEVLWNGVVVQTLDGSTPGWQLITLNLTGTGTDVLAFRAAGPAGEQNELGAFLDDVSLREFTSVVTDDEDTNQTPAVEIQGGPGDDGAGVTSSGKINFDAGADGLASIVLNGPSGLSAIWVDGSGIAHQQAISYVWTPAGAGGTLYGVSTNFPDALNPVFSIAVDANGNYTFTQKAPLVHPATSDGNAGNGLEIEWEDNLTIPFGFTITDGDGDTATGQIAISVDDDTPDAVAEASQDIGEGLTTAIGQLDFVTGADGATVTHINGNLLTFAGDGWATVNVALGTLKVKADGQYQFTAANPTNSPVPPVVFTYTVTDGDGDMSSSTLTFQITDVNAPVSGTAAAAVDDDGLAGNNPASTLNDLNANLVGDGDASEAVFTGMLGGSVGDDIPGVFSFAALHGTSGTVGTETVNYAWASNTLMATGPRGPLFKVEITNPSTGAYKVTLLDNVLHAVAADGENLVDPTTTLSYTITDSDNSLATGTLTITFDDDAPTASAEATQNVAEGATTPVAMLDFAQGADGATVTHINGNPLMFAGDGWATVNVALGTLKVKADGQYQFTAANPTNNPVTVTFGYTVTDGDGDMSSSTLTFQITDANAPASGTAAAAVDDDGLSGNNPASTLNDLNANLGDNAGDTNEATFTGTLGGSVGGDVPGVFSFAALHGTSGTVGAEMVSYTWASNILTAMGPRGPLFTVQVTNPSTGAYKVTLLDNVLHAVAADGENATDPTTSIAYTITDSDGTSAPGTLTITFDDDAPTATSDTISTLITGVYTTANLLSNDAFGADGVDIDNSPTPGQVTVGSVVGGAVVYNNNGTFTYTPTAGFNGVASFSYTIKDADGDTSTATVTLNNVHANTLPTAGTATNAVDDEGLTGGVAGSTFGDDQPGQNVVVNGVLPHNYNSDGQAASDPINFAPMHGTSGMVGTESVTYGWNPANNTLTASSAARGPIFTVVVDGGSDTGAGNYVFTLLKPILHTSGGNENDETVVLTYQVKDATLPVGDVATGTLTIALDDDIPIAAPITKTVVEGSSDTNILLMLDRSGSMAFDPEVAGYATRLALMKAAAIALLDQYDAVGDIKVQIIQFNNNAQKQTQVPDSWLTIDEAKTFINTLSANDGTDYDDAVELARLDAFNDPGKLTSPGVRNVSYFLSDGVPEPTDEQVSGAELTDWINFVNANEIISYAIGLGANAPDTYLDPIAYDGRGAGTDTDALIVTDLNQLQTTLVGTVNPSISASIVDGSIPTSFGADGGFVQSIALPGSTYAYNPSTNAITVTGANNGTFDPATHKLTITFPGSTGESFVIDLDDGAYVYTPPTTITADLSRVFTYTLADRDGDSATSTLTINVDNVNGAPVLDATDSPALAAISEDAAAPSGPVGSLVSSLIDLPGGGGFNNVTDSDGPGVGIAVTGVNSTNGTWFYSTNNGGSWTAVSPVTATSALLLAADASTRLYFKPNLNFSGTVSDGITFRPWDQSTGMAGTKVDTSVNGGATAFSTATDTASIVVTAVNDAPTLTTGSTLSYTENGAAAAINTAITVGDVDNSTLASATVAITGNFTSGQDVLGFANVGMGNIVGVYNPATGVMTLTSAGATATLAQWQAALRAVTYSNTSENPNTASRTISYQLDDGQAVNDLSNIVTSTVTVASINDAPVIALDNSHTVSDDFSSGYGGGSGWMGSWTEEGDGATGAGSGDIRIESGRVRFVGNSADANDAIKRSVDLTGATSATLSFNFEDDSVGSANLIVEGWNGTAWIEIGTILGGGQSSGSYTFSEPLASELIGSHTQIRIRLANGLPNNDDYFIDDINIAVTKGFIENGPAVSIVQLGSLITDVDDTNMESATVVLANKQAGDQLLISGVPVSNGSVGTVAGIGYLVADNGSQITITLTGSASKASYESAIEAIAYRNTSQDPATVDRIVNVTVNDGSANSSTAVATIEVVAVNDAPSGTNKVISLVEDVTYTFTSADFGFSDVDGDNFAGVVIDTLPAATAGVLRLGNTAIVAGAFITAADIANGSLIFTPVDNVVGATGDTSFTFSVRDDGPSGGTNANEDQTPNTMTLDMSTTNYTNTENLNSNGNHAYTAALNVANFSIQDTDASSNSSPNSSGDSLRLDTVAGTSFEALNFFRSDNNLEISWTEGASSPTITLLNHFSTGNTNGNDSDIETLTFQNGGTYEGYSLGSGAYLLDNDLSGSSSADILSGTAGDDTISGSGGNDLLFGNGGDDVLTGGTGNDLLVGGLGADKFRLQADGGEDVIADFVIGTDRIALLEGGTGGVSFAGTAPGQNLNASDFQTRGSILDIQGGDDNHVVRITDAQTQTQIEDDDGANNSSNIYVLVFNSDTGFGEIWFDSDWDNSAGRVKIATLASITSLAQLNTITEADFAVYSSSVDPLILDLGTDGITFTGLDNGVSFDIDADGALDQIAWTTGQDGILALDVDGNGTIDNGAEIFSPYFAGGEFASSLAALASLDSNGDGVMDANDAQFANLTVWQDLNHDGVSQANELSDLAAHGITGIDLQATPTDTTIDGQQVVSEGTFTTADGTNGTFVEVAFDTALAPNAANEPHTFVLGNANETASIADYSAARGDVIDVSGLLEAHFGEGSQVSDFVNVLQDGSDVTIQIDQNGPASGAHFVDVAVLHGYGTSASDIVRIAFENVEQQIAV